MGPLIGRQILMGSGSANFRLCSLGKEGVLDHPDATSEEDFGFVAVDFLDLLVDVVRRLV